MADFVFTPREGESPAEQRHRMKTERLVWDAQKAKGEFLTPEEKRAKTARQKKARQEAIKKARAVRMNNLKTRKDVIKKVAQGKLITSDEATIIQRNEVRERLHARRMEELGRTAELLIKPSSVAQLRAMVEQTAKDMDYNPMKSLIELAQKAQDEGLIEQAISIHKTLLPFLVPALSATKADDAEKDKGGLNVVIEQIQFDGAANVAPDRPLHEQKPNILTLPQEPTLVPTPGPGDVDPMANAVPLTLSHEHGNDDSTTGQ